MESERDAWGLSSADWCHVAINFKRSARIVQTSFPVLLFLKKKRKKKKNESHFPLSSALVAPSFPDLPPFEPLLSESRGFIPMEGNGETRDGQRARIFSNPSFVISRKRWQVDFLFFLKRRNKNVSSRKYCKYW